MLYQHEAADDLREEAAYLDEAELRFERLLVFGD
jgi:hypothetical protein